METLKTKQTHKKTTPNVQTQRRSSDLWLPEVGVGGELELDKVVKSYKLPDMGSKTQLNDYS